MYIVKINNLNKLFAAFFILFISAIAITTPLLTDSASAASQTDFLNAVSHPGCGSGSGRQTNYISPYDDTKTMCIGPEYSNTVYYWQLEVGFRGPVKNGVVTAKNDDNQTIPFDQTDGTSTMYVSIPSGGDAYGYSLSIDPTYSNCANLSQKASKITVTATGNGDSQTSIVDLCSLLLNNGKPNGIVKIHADSIRTDAEMASGNTSQVTGTIRGTLGIYRDGIPKDALLAGDSRFMTPILPQGVTSIKLTGTTADGQPVDISAPATSFTGSGNLTIGSLKQGIYNLEIHYNDAQAAAAIGGNQSLVISYLSQDVKLNFNDIQVVAGDNWLTNKDGTIQYYGSDGKPVDPTQVAASAKLTCGNQVPGVGWIVCPIVNGLSTLNDGMWSITSSLLKVDPIQSSDPIHAAWSTIKNLANIAFVVVFLIIIFSQLTSVGITNYGVKKMLPRLIISAILVNISFLVIQILVDVSNIIGTSLYDLIVGAAPKITPTWTQLITLITTAAASTAGVAAAIAIVGGASAAFWIILPMAAIAMLGLLAAVLTLIFRQAVIPILAILSPLAFVALLLPNTESWFKKWRSMLVNLLMLYPMAALVFGGAQFTAAVMVNKNDWWSYLIGLLVLALPLFSLPFLARQGGPLLSKVGGSLNGLAGKIGKPIAGLARPRQELAKNKYLSASGSVNPFKRIALSGNRKGKLTQLKNSAYQAQQNAGFNADLRENAEDYASGMPDGSVAQSYIRGAAARAEAEELKSEMAPLTSEIAAQRASNADFDLDGFLRNQARNGQTEMRRVAAMHYAASVGRDNVMRELISSGDPEITRHAQEAISANAGSLAGKAPDLVKPASVAFGTVTGSELAQFSAYTMEAYVQHLSTLQAAASAPGAKPDAIEKLETATASFNSAVQDITNSPDLQSKFSSGSGKAIQNAIASIGGGFEAYASSALTGLGSIKTDGKIRP